MTSPSRIGYFIGMALADIVNLFRGRQAVPCLVDWDDDPHAVAERRDERYRILFGPVNDSSAATVAELNAMQEVKGLTAAGFNADPEPFDQGYYADGDDCCPDYEVDCCLETDTIGEAQGKC